MAGRREEPGHPKQLLPEPKEVGGRALGAGEDRLLDPLDPFAHSVLDREVAVHQALEQGIRQAGDPVQLVPLVMLPAPARFREHSEHRGRPAMDRDQVVLTPEQVQLSRQDHVAGLFGGIDHDEVVAGVGIAPRAFVRPGHVFERQFVEAEGLPEHRDLGGTGVADVEPQPILAVGEQLAEPVHADLRRQAAVARVKDESHGSHGASSIQDLLNLRSRFSISTPRPPTAGLVSFSTPPYIIRRFPLPILMTARTGKRPKLALPPHSPRRPHMHRSITGSAVRIAGALLVIAVPLAAQDSPPPYLQIFREEVKPGRAGLHVITESGWPRAFARAKTQNYYLAMTTVYGPPEAWFLEGHGSVAELDQSNQAIDSVPGLSAELDRLAQADAANISGLGSVLGRYRAELSNGVPVDLTQMRVWEVLVFQVRPGHEADFME